MSASNLLEAKLRGLVRNTTGEEIERRDAPGSAGGILASGDGYLLAYERDPARSVGPAISWAAREGITSLNLLADADVSGDLARRAAWFRNGPTVLAVDGINTSPAVASDLPEVPVLQEDEMAFLGVMTEAGATALNDHGRLVAEYAGLEVARVTRNLDGVAELEVGVGQADRELQALVHGGLERVEALARAIELVAEHRRPGAPMHPLNRLARERWLRSILLASPEVVGCENLAPMPPLLERSTLLGMVPSAASGTRPDGSLAVVVCAVGIELDLVADALDYRSRLLATEPGSPVDLILVMPERDTHRIIEEQAAQAERVSIVSITEPWARSQQQNQQAADSEPGQ